MDLKRIISSIGIGAGALVIGLGIQYALAQTWSAAPSNPPSGNVAAPVNVSSSAQAKSGNLALGTSTTQSSSLDVEGVSYLRSLILGSDKGPTFQYLDGNQGTGKVLTSDANGNATWQTASSSGAGGLNSIGTITTTPSSGIACSSSNGQNAGSMTLTPSGSEIVISCGNGSESINFPSGVTVSGYPITMYAGQIGSSQFVISGFGDKISIYGPNSNGNNASVAFLGSMSISKARVIGTIMGNDPLGDYNSSLSITAYENQIVPLYGGLPAYGYLAFFQTSSN